MQLVVGDLHLTRLLVGVLSDHHERHESSQALYAVLPAPGEALEATVLDPGIRQADEVLQGHQRFPFGLVCS